ncbi:hypothetical protein FRC14_003542 [Serendipita sp. 396]|nr:hypothetical protein FRC14_003542 [Serendipita sp. 396]
MNTAANILENTMRKGDGQASITTDVANPASNPEKYADPSMTKMKALAWQGANDVQMGELRTTQITTTPHIFLLFQSNLSNLKSSTTRT